MAVRRHLRKPRNKLLASDGLMEGASCAISGRMHRATLQKPQSLPRSLIKMRSIWYTAPCKKTGSNVTGVSDMWPVLLQMETYAKFVPQAKKWGTDLQSDRSELRRSRQSYAWGPVERFSLVINLKAVRAQGVTVSPELSTLPWRPWC